MLTFVILGGGYTSVCYIIFCPPLYLKNTIIKIKKFYETILGVLHLGTSSYRTEKGPLKNMDSNFCFNPSSLQVSIQFKIIESGHVILFMQGTGFSLQINPLPVVDRLKTQASSS